jgi:hypothetical protein
MIFEYAVEPILMTQKGTSSNIVNSFGPDKGRLISDFPEGWYDEVRSLIRKTKKPMANKASINRLNRLCEQGTVIKRVPQKPWAKRSWLTNAETENSLRPFQAILADVEDANLNKNIIPGQSADECYDCMKVKRAITVSRNKEDMGKTIKPLLELSREIVFVDRYFNPKTQSFLDVLEHFLEIVSNRQSDIPLVRVIYHFSFQERMFLDEEEFKEIATEKLEPIIPKHINLIFQESPDGSFHERLVLTNIGSVDMGIGLQEYVSGTNSTEKSEIKNIGLAKDMFYEFTSKEIFHQVQGKK